MKYVVCFSGGHSSSLVAVESVRRYGRENVILLNHDISPVVEHEDIKRFKNEVANYLGIPITYANMPDFELITPIDIALNEGCFQANVGQALCTNRLKTRPFHKWLSENFPVEKGKINDDVVILYGFDMNEPKRIQRRSSIMANMGYKTDYPLAFWDRTIENIEDIGIKRPVTYEIFKHANCIGCLKAGKQHWYVVYCLYPEIFKKAMYAENEIGYSIIKGSFLDELLPKYKEMKCRGIVPSDKVNFATFWANVRKVLKENEDLPCECSF